jgi:hypothetical protein
MLQLFHQKAGAHHITEALLDVDLDQGILGCFPGSSKETPLLSFFGHSRHDHQQTDGLEAKKISSQ